MPCRVCVCVCACVRACVRAWGGGGGGGGERPGGSLHCMNEIVTFMNLTLSVYDFYTWLIVMSIYNFYPLLIVKSISNFYTWLIVMFVCLLRLCTNEDKFLCNFLM